MKSNSTTEKDVKQLMVCLQLAQEDTSLLHSDVTDVVYSLTYVTGLDSGWAKQGIPIGKSRSRSMPMAAGWWNICLASGPSCRLLDEWYVFTLYSEWLVMLSQSTWRLFDLDRAHQVEGFIHCFTLISNKKVTMGIKFSTAFLWPRSGQ